MLVSNFQMAKFYPQLPPAFSSFLSFLICLLLLQLWNFPNIKMSCRKNRSEILAPHLVIWLPPSLAMKLHSSKQIILWQRICNGVEMSFLQVTASQVSPVEEKLEVEEMGHPITLCFGSCNSRRRIEVVQVIIRKSRPQWLNCRMFVTRSAKRGYWQKKTLQTALSVCFPAASHTIPVAPYPAVPGTLSTPGTPVPWYMTKPSLYPSRYSCLWANKHLRKLCTVYVPRAMQTTEQMEIAPIQTLFHTWHFITLQKCSSRGTDSTSLPSRSTLHPLPNVLQQ